jgi:amino acid adenylation domain-containing protein
MLEPSLESAADLIGALRARDVRCWTEGDRLRLSAPAGALTAELQAELTRRKPEIVAYLKAAEGAELAPGLTRADRAGELPLSFAQERLWFHQRLEPGSIAYNLQANIALPGRPDAARVERALTALVARHEILRTTFAEREGRPVQVIAAAPARVAVAVSDLGGLPVAERGRAAARLASEEVRRPFDLAAGPVFRARLLVGAGASPELLFTQHHIVTDGWSIALLVNELLALYGGATLPVPEFQYADFAAWQRESLAGERLDARLAHWRLRLAGAAPFLELPADRPRPPVQTAKGNTLHATLPESLQGAVAALARAEGVTPFMVLLAGFQALLARLTGQSDIVVGTANGNRSLVETEAMFGLFVNTVVLRTDVSGDPRFRELLGRVRRVCLDAFANGDLPFEKLVEHLRPPRDHSRSPLFQVLFVIQNTPLEALTRASEGVAAVVGERDSAAYDLSVYVVDTGRGLRVSLEYNTDLFDDARMARFARQYEELLGAACAAPTARVSELSVLPRAERELLLGAWNATGREVAFVPVHEQVAAQALLSPDAVALTFEGRDLTYAALDARANRLARRLRSLGVGTEVRVAIALERSLDMVVALLAVLKAGGAYLPLDPAFPPERLAYMLQDADVRVLLTEEGLRAALPAGAAEVICLDSLDLAGESDGPLGLAVDPQQLAYVIYTSGSTGRPKGVQIPHGALANFLASMAEDPGFAAGETLLSVTTLSFDIAGLELYLPLVRGGRVALASRRTAADGTALLETLRATGAGVMQATPATWRLLLEAGWHGRTLRVLCGGEALPGDLAAELLARGASVHNLYGPTETTIWSTRFQVAEAEAVTPLGRPIANTRVYVLDAHGQPVPIGVPGELHIGGAGLARGYRGRPDLTAERFVPDALSGVPGARLYKTGDSVRFRADGVLEFLGRNDHQVKVRGHRVEIGEIEAALVEMAAVKAAAVVPSEATPGDVQLVAYVVFGAGGEPTVTELRAALRATLPGYMVPASFVTLDVLPLTPNGKLDRRALASVDAAQRTGAPDPVEPRTDMERLVAGLWMETLGLERVSVHDNFFDIGGHSLLAMRVLARVEAAVGVSLNPRELVFQTLEQFAAACDEHARGAAGGAA